MIEHVYRFRTTDALLGKRQELERQQIFFAPTDQLNDPMEGYIDLMWRGDGTLWENLLKHYLQCLATSTIHALLAPESEPTVYEDFIWQTRCDVQHLPISRLHEDLFNELAQSAIGKAVLANLSRINRPIRRDELCFYLWVIHPIAHQFLTSLLAQKDLIPALPAAPLSDMSDFLKHLDKLVALSDDEVLSSAAFAASNNLMSQIILLNECNASSQSSDKSAWRLVTQQFPSFYCTALEKLVFPKWRVACFVAQPRNASMWGSYGDSHKGICLKFRTHTRNAHETLRLRSCIGWKSNSPDITEPMFGEIPHLLEKVRYANDREEIEFFSSLGRIRRDRLDDWINNSNGVRSSLLKSPPIDSAEWRQYYWDKFSRCLALKTQEWAHEQEYRLVLSAFDSTRIDTCIGEYKFEDLSGIIFGARTAESEKVSIIQVIDKKCRLVNRHDFEFYQTRYSAKGTNLNIEPLSLIKVGRD